MLAWNFTLNQSWVVITTRVFLCMVTNRHVSLSKTRTLVRWRNEWDGVRHLHVFERPRGLVKGRIVGISNANARCEHTKPGIHVLCAQTLCTMKMYAWQRLAEADQDADAPHALTHNLLSCTCNM
jgi:hypothetical protein